MYFVVVAEEPGHHTVYVVADVVVVVVVVVGEVMVVAAVLVVGVEVAVGVVVVVVVVVGVVESPSHHTVCVVRCAILVPCGEPSFPLHPFLFQDMLRFGAMDTQRIRASCTEHVMVCRVALGTLGVDAGSCQGKGSASCRTFSTASIILGRPGLVRVRAPLPLLPHPHTFAPTRFTFSYTLSILSGIFTI